MLPICFSAADLVFIQRSKILNSGNIPMGFFFNKTVVGPSVGNLTELLNIEGNFSFDPYIQSSILYSLEKATNTILNKHVYNESYAKENWRTDTICDKYIECYQRLLEL